MGQAEFVSNMQSSHPSKCLTPVMQDSSCVLLEHSNVKLTWDSPYLFPALMVTLKSTQTSNGEISKKHMVMCVCGLETHSTAQLIKVNTV